ncbi:MAG: twin transmembrane helix small protein [Alphaproteobacteria bacterium]|nr:twin transmembrane helix small protein [Alphaproteobacteria bacterium]
MQTALTILLITAMAGTLVVLALGVVQMVRGDSNGKRSNTLMQYRVLFQGLAIALFLGLALLLKG